MSTPLPPHAATDLLEIAARNEGPAYATDWKDGRIVWLLAAAVGEDAERLSAFLDAAAVSDPDHLPPTRPPYSPLPWRVNPEAPDEIQDAADRLVADLFANEHTTPEEDVANAALIVALVNLAHPLWLELDRAVTREARFLSPRLRALHRQLGRILRGESEGAP